MKNILLKYMNNRVADEIEYANSVVGPLITISREYGCGARSIAEKVISLIKENTSANKEDWVVINKTIIEKTANELNLDPKFIKKVTNSESKGIFDELIMSFSEEYIPSDIRIKNTIASVIRESSKDGNKIIIGRSGASILKNVEKSLHIRLEASEDYRANRLMSLHGLTDSDARKRIRNTDKNRNHIRNFFEGKEQTNKDNYLFDIIFNCETLSTDEIAEGIFLMLKIKKMV